eukprot:13204915-Ditylum_brightwellii.AAC.1
MMHAFDRKDELQTELANVQAVNTTLGGGMNGYVGLVMTPMDYTLIPGTSAYMHPTEPTLVLTAGGTQYQIIQGKKQYYGNFCQLNKRNTIKKS